MALATLTSKGQVTIPKEIRTLLKLQSGDKIEISPTENGEAIIKPISKKVDDIFCKLHKPGKNPVTLKDIDTAIRNRMRNRFK